MNLSHAYSDHAAKPRSYLGIGVVVALHLVGIYALSAGLIRSPASQPGPITVKPVKEVVETPPPVEVVQAKQPEFKNPNVIQIQPPDIVVERQTDQPPPVTVVIGSEPPPPFIKGKTGTELTQPLPPTVQPAVGTAGAVCSVMPQPEIPALNWSGEAVLQVLATVRGGRVVGSDVRVMHGALDGKTRRSLQRSVETALAGYQCRGDAMFQQDFAFRID